jgi:2-dehydro-3-deoxygluconokinase
MGRVACLGECMIELVEQPDGRLTRGFGGDTLNTALYLARLGVPTAYVTALGADPFSDALLDAWQAEGIDTGTVLRLPGRLPGLYMIQTDPAGERRFHYWRDSAPVRQLFDLPETPAIEAALAASELIYLSGVTLSLFGDTGRARLFDTLARARLGGAMVAFDTNFRPRGWPDRRAAQRVYERMIDSADIVLASIEDYQLLDDSEDARALADRLQAAGVPEIVVKLMEPACRVISAGVDTVVRGTPATNAVDTTAAGDSFSAGYIAARRAGAAPATAAAAGHRLAGAVVRHRGAIIPREAMPSPASILEAL